jgi:hypothetical protein
VRPENGLNRVPLDDSHGPHHDIGKVASSEIFDEFLRRPLAAPELLS